LSLRPTDVTDRRLLNRLWPKAFNLASGALGLDRSLATGLQALRAATRGREPRERPPNALFFSPSSPDGRGMSIQNQKSKMGNLDTTILNPTAVCPECLGTTAQLDSNGYFSECPHCHGIGIVSRRPKPGPIQKAREAIQRAKTAGKRQEREILRQATPRGLKGLQRASNACPRCRGLGYKAGDSGLGCRHCGGMGYR